MTTLDRQRSSLPATPLANVLPAYDVRPVPTVETEPGMGEMLGRLHRMMQGRYLICTVLAIACAGGLAYGGFRLGEKTFRSTGLIRIVPTLPRIMYETEDKGVMPMFDSFVQTQVSMIKMQRVQELALEDQSWPVPPRRDNTAVAEFAKRLSVVRDNELISVTFDDPDPAFAQNAVKCVINAYEDLYKETNGHESERVLTELLTKQTALNRDLEANRTRIRAIAEHYGTDKIDEFFRAQLDTVQKLEKQVADLSFQKTTFLAQSKLPNGETAEALARQDQTLQDLLRSQAAARSELRMSISRGENNPQVIQLRSTLSVLDQEVKERAEELQSTENSKAIAEALDKEIATANDSLTQARQQLKNIGQEQFQLADLQREAAGLNEVLGQTKSRIEQINTEAPFSTGRIALVSPGDRPLVPVRDTRRTFGIAGGMLGFILPFGAALLLSSANRRYGAPVETRMSSITRDLVLGALPRVDENKFDPETSQLAAHCLHQVRTMLQIRCNGHAKAIAITSPMAGSGKTSVVLGLGVSYAMAGSRTLLIDLDLVGGGLTRRVEVNARARLGQLLLTQGLVTAEQLENALATAKAESIKLGEAFVRLGYLNDEQLQTILHEQKRSHVGLMDALNGALVKDCVTSAGTEGLDILPLGSANAHDAATLSPTEIKSVIDEAKSLYDTVLIDTGPVPGSLEASMVSSLTDGVLLVVARGEHRAGAERSIEHIRRIGGRVAGLVFNRAKPSDAGLIGGSMYRASQSSRPAAPSPAPTAARQAASARFGPVGQAVIDITPAAPL